MRDVELLIPASNLEVLKVAVMFGADAVYIGGEAFGLRAKARNFSKEEMAQGIAFAHEHGVKVYVTVNILAHNYDLAGVREYLKELKELKPDALIIADPGIFTYAKEICPEIERHISTQANNTNYETYRFWYKLGAKRVVTARELSLEEIRQIRANIPDDMEIETFIHGAMCISYSGRCLLSNFLVGRDANQGACTHPCRWKYSIVEETRPGEYMPVYENERGTYIFNSKDLCMIGHIPELIDAGIDSFKIEGRMKSPRYTAGVVSIYRKYVDRYLEQGRDGYFVEPEDRKMLLDLFDRGGFTDGYYARHNGRGMVALKEKPEFREGNQKLFEYLDKTYVVAELKEKVRGHVELAEGEPSRLTLESRGEKVQVLGQAPQAAEHQPMTREKVLKQLNKTGGSPFSFETLTAQIEGDLFLPVQALNELRRTGFQELEKKLTGARVLTGEGGIGAQFRPVPTKTAAPQSQSVLTAFLEETAQLSPVLARGEISVVYLDADGFNPDQWRDIADRCHDRGKQCWLALPQIFRSHAQRYLGANRRLLCQAGFDGVLIRALEEAVWLKDLMEQENQKTSLPFGMDASVYGWNSRSAEVLASMGTSLLTMPWELNSREIEPVLGACRGLGMASELIIYGNAPMMVSAQCITNTVKGCTHKRGTLMMKDRTGALLPVKNHCSFCYNTIYNPAPLSLLGSEKLVGRLMPDRLRLQFTVEGTEQTEKVLDAFIGSFVYGRDVEAPFRDFTRGHFKRGVE